MKNRYLICLLLVLVSGCAALNKPPPEILPGRHAYAISTVAGHGWVEFSCQRTWDFSYPKKTGPMNLIRRFYSERKSLNFSFERADGTIQEIKLPGCDKVETDGQFPSSLFLSRQNSVPNGCPPQYAQIHSNFDGRSYRCWGNYEEFGFVVEYFYSPDSSLP